MDPPLVEELGDLLDGLGVVDDVQRAGVHLQPPLELAPHRVAFVRHLKDRGRCGVRGASCQTARGYLWLHWGTGWEPGSFPRRSVTTLSFSIRLTWEGRDLRQSVKFEFQN